MGEISYPTIRQRLTEWTVAWSPIPNWQKAKVECGLKEKALKPMAEYEPVCF